MDALASFFSDFDIGSLLPEMDTFLGQLQFWLRLFVIVGPLIMLTFGLLYFFKPSDSPRKRLGFRSYFTSGSDEAWQFAQRIAGLCWMVLGGVLFVIMLIISLFFGKMDALKMATTALVCVSIELLLVIAGQVFINVWVLKFFDRDGNPK